MTTIYRIAQRLRKAQDITYQVTVEKVSDAKVLASYPQIVREAINAIISQLDVIKSQADLVDVYKDREQERDEVMIGITQELANISTVLGGDGKNLQILTHSDPAYIKGVLVDSDEMAFIKSIKSMSDNEKNLFLDKLKKGGLVE